MGITRAKKRLFLSHAHTRMLYNARNANQLSRFVSEIPRRLIQEGAVRANTRMPMPGSRPMAAASSAPKASFGIQGVQKGFAGQGAAAPQQRTLKIFKEGDRVIHAVFGRGNVTRLEGDKVCVKFDTGSEKRFSANIAPLRKLD